MSSPTADGCPDALAGCGFVTFTDASRVVNVAGHKFRTKCISEQYESDSDKRAILECHPVMFDLFYFLLELKRLILQIAKYNKHPETWKHDTVEVVDKSIQAVVTLQRFSSEPFRRINGELVGCFMKQLVTIFPILSREIMVKRDPSVHVYNWKSKPVVESESDHIIKVTSEAIHDKIRVIRKLPLSIPSEEPSNPSYSTWITTISVWITRKISSMLNSRKRRADDSSSREYSGGSRDYSSGSREYSSISVSGVHGRVGGGGGGGGGGSSDDWSSEASESSRPRVIRRRR